jgi:MerR-like DNA binding protein
MIAHGAGSAATPVTVYTEGSMELAMLTGLAALERTSLGTANAREARGRATAARVAHILDHSEQFGIGEVIAQLRGEFPDISVAKIRFLEAEGLIQPARSPSGYRKFGPAAVDRLRYILTAQRDQYLPLRVIKDQLDADLVPVPRPTPQAYTRSGEPKDRAG